MTPRNCSYSQAGSAGILRSDRSDEKSLSPRHLGLRKPHPKMRDLEARKLEEIEFHNTIRSAAVLDDPEAYEYYRSNEKFYAIDRANRTLCESWLRERCRGKQVLDYCCGEGYYSMFVAEHGGEVTGVDISDVSIEGCRDEARKRGVSHLTHFQVMDAERLEFPDDAFDYIVCAGVLHHLDLARAYPELARVLRPGGEIICMEPLRHNPLIQVYRRRTPHLRTAYEAEHILGREDLVRAEKYFGRVERRFFHLATLAAVPFRNTVIFSPLLWSLEKIDGILLRVPGLRWLAWMTVFFLSRPRKDADPSKANAA